MTSRYYGGKISRFQQSFLTETVIALSNDGRKVWATVLLLSAIMHRKFILVNVVPVFAGPRFVEVQTFCCHGNVM